MYSVMSILTMFRSESNKNSASVLHNSVLPTPVGPRKKKEAMGRESVFSPALVNRMASHTAFTASICPTTRFSRCPSMLISRSRSLFIMFCTGMPVALETTKATSFEVTYSWRKPASGSLGSSVSVVVGTTCSSSWGMTPYRSSLALPRSPFRWASSSSILAASNSCLTAFNFSNLFFSCSHFLVSSSDLSCKSFSSSSINFLLSLLG
eukprot:Lithocolla_globosa_v1_NODE_1634_length_2432_cov_41.369794.p3 type:complete len:208 gc:universal NODE_1634_length_2432_cov_41.369794:1656-1033(-)